MLSLSRRAQESISLAILGVVAVLALVGLVMLFANGLGITGAVGDDRDVEKCAKLTQRFLGQTREKVEDDDYDEKRERGEIKEDKEGWVDCCNPSLTAKEKKKCNKFIAKAEKHGCLPGLTYGGEPCDTGLLGDCTTGRAACGLKGVCTQTVFPTAPNCAVPDGDADCNGIPDGEDPACRPIGCVQDKPCTSNADCNTGQPGDNSFCNVAGEAEICVRDMAECDAMRGRFLGQTPICGRDPNMPYGCSVSSGTGTCVDQGACATDADCGCANQRCQISSAGVVCTLAQCEQACSGYSAAGAAVVDACVRACSDATSGNSMNGCADGSALCMRSVTDPRVCDTAEMTCRDSMRNCQQTTGAGTCVAAQVDTCGNRICEPTDMPGCPDCGGQCSVITNPDGSLTVSCTDGTRQDYFSCGELSSIPGFTRDTCRVNQRPDGSMLVECMDGTVAVMSCGGAVCGNGVCEPGESPACTDCLAQCASNQDCDTVHTCSNGVCAPNPDCTPDGRCPIPGMLCSGTTPECQWDCRTGVPCPTGQTCGADGLCSSLPTTCDDGNACTTDVSGPMGWGCIHSPVTDGTPCPMPGAPGICSGGTCVASSSSCGDGRCDAIEADPARTTYCAQDCGGTTACAGGTCGNAWCELGENLVCCAQDCAQYCGDRFCDPGVGETPTICPSDCGTIGICGDRTCDPAIGESCSNCIQDCGQCPASCGNDRCELGEDALSCPFDCARYCGDRFCDSGLGENMVTCPPDCGSVA